MAKMENIKIEDADDEAIRAFLVTVQGIDVPANAKRATLLSKLSAVGWDKDYVTVLVDHAEEPQGAPPPAPEGEHKRDDRMPQPVKAGGTPGDQDPKVVIIIAEQNIPGGKRPVFVSVNGVGLLIARAKEQAVPLRYFLALQNAVESQYTQDEDDPDAEIIESQVPSYPFQVISGPSQDEIAVWHKEQQFVGMSKDQVAAAKEAQAAA